MIQKTIRQCCITKKYFSRNDLYRIIRLKNGEVLFDTQMKHKGRSIHFSKNMYKKIFHEKKRKMIEHFLKISIPLEKWNNFCNKTLSSLEKN